MNSSARRKANRANALHSTGPRTPEGKARSSKNAVKHGFNCAGFIVAENQREEFEELRSSLTSQIKPISTVERETFTQLLHAAWNLRRVRLLQAELLDFGLDPLANPELDGQMDRYARYEVRFERSYYRAIKELRRLKTDSLLCQTLPESIAETIPGLVSPEEIRRAIRTRIKAPSGPVDDIISYAMGESPAPDWFDGLPEHLKPSEFGRMPSK